MARIEGLEETLNARRVQQEALAASIGETYPQTSSQSIGAAHGASQLSPQMYLAMLNGVVMGTVDKETGRVEQGFSASKATKTTIEQEAESYGFSSLQQYILYLALIEEEIRRPKQSDRVSSKGDLARAITTFRASISASKMDNGLKKEILEQLDQAEASNEVQEEFLHKIVALRNRHSDDSNHPTLSEIRAKVFSNYWS